MAKKTKILFVEKELSKGELRKLNALRKSLGAEIADKAFTEWLHRFGRQSTAQKDKVAVLIAETLEPLIIKKNLSLPRGGYVVRRGRGRVIVEKVKTN